MKRFTLILFLLLVFLLQIKAQSEFGYALDIGYRENFNIGEKYDQSVFTYQHNFFIRNNHRSGLVATQWQVGLRVDSVHFINNTEFLDFSRTKMNSYDVEAYLERYALKFGFVTQYQLSDSTKRFTFSFNHGLHYEASVLTTRYGISDGEQYNLGDEVNMHNLLFSLGAEMRFNWYVDFFIGYKFEKPFRDLINHKYINNLPVNADNSSELRGMRLDQGISFVYLGMSICIDKIIDFY